MIRLFSRSLVLLSAFLFFGCATITQPTTYSYDEFLDLVATDSGVDLVSAEVDLLDSNLSSNTLTELDDFSRQVEQLLDRPIRLGSLGSAILDRLESSYAGHLAMYHFYKHFENEHAAVHNTRIERIVEYMTAERDGSLQKPYRALSRADALLFTRHSGYRVIGSIYIMTNVEPLVLRVLRVREEQPYEEVFFDLSALFPVLVQELKPLQQENAPLGWPEVVTRLASAGDSAAQLSLGRIFASGGAISRAESMYLTASRADNGYAHMLYADLFVDEAFKDQQRNPHRFLQIAQSQYTQAIEYGYHTALRQLGILLYRGIFGEDMISQGMEMLERAASLEDTLAIRYLGDVFRFGIGEDIDLEKAASLYQQAAQLGDPRARIDYYRVLAQPGAGLVVTEQVVDWLVDSASNDDVLAMLELGNCHARGCIKKPNYRKALYWYRKAVRTAPDSPEVVNSVAWTLAVTDQKRLRRPDYALEIIEHLMASDEASRANPMYVDTWAAVHAALGDFPRAIELQREALALAVKEQRTPGLLNEIESHLDSFLKGEALRETVP